MPKAKKPRLPRRKWALRWVNRTPARQVPTTIRRVHPRVPTISPPGHLRVVITARLDHRRARMMALLLRRRASMVKATVRPHRRMATIKVPRLPVSRRVTKEKAALKGGLFYCMKYD